MEVLKIVAIILAALAITGLLVREFGLSMNERKKLKGEIERTHAEIRARKEQT
jgi:FtsZ-interacting cell division protein ZipA